MLARKKKPDPVLNWHPNFRVVESLPDIKQVRTGFLVNFVAIFFALIALGWTIYNEVEIHNVNREIARLQSQIDGNDKGNKKGLAATTSFVNESKPLQFAAHFFAQKISPLELFTTLVDARPDSILFTSVEISTLLPDNKKRLSQRLTISGTLSSSTELALDDFVTKIMSSPVLKSRIEDPVKDSKFEAKRIADGVFQFTITINLKPIP